jgi:hypothetical protein
MRPTIVYWIEGDGHVMAVPSEGGDAVVLASEQGQLHDIAVDEASVYWTAEANSVAEGGVFKTSLSGGDVIPLVSAPEARYATGIAVDGTSVYWTNSAMPGALYKIPIEGGTPTTVLGNLVFGGALAIDDRSVYWVTSLNSGSVAKLSFDDGTVVGLASAQTLPQSIAVDSTSVYWTNSDSGEVMKITPK